MCDADIDVFFFEQKTADELRISDWSSDVCSSDLGAAAQFTVAVAASLPQAGDMLGQRRVAIVQPRPQVGALAGEQAGVQAAAGGHARAVAIAAERRADRKSVG